LIEWDVNLNSVPPFSALTLLIGDGRTVGLSARCKRFCFRTGRGRK